VRSLAVDCLLPMRLRDVGVPEDALSTIAETALGDAASFTNPRSITYNDALDVLRAAW
jgi:alcohol dehydrogenase